MQRCMGNVVHFKEEESAIEALIYEQHSYYYDGQARRLLHVNFHQEHDSKNESSRRISEDQEKETFSPSSGDYPNDEKYIDDHELIEEAKRYESLDDYLDDRDQSEFMKDKHSKSTCQHYSLNFLQETIIFQQFCLSL